MNKMAKRTITGSTLFVILFGFILLTHFSQFIFDTLILIFFTFSLYEMLKLGNKFRQERIEKKVDSVQFAVDSNNTENCQPSTVNSHNRLNIPIIITATLIYPMIFLFGLIGFVSTLGFGFLLLFTFFTFDQTTDLKAFFYNVFVLIYPIALLSTTFLLIYGNAGLFGNGWNFNLLKQSMPGMLPFLIPVAAAMMSDTFALYFGSMIKGPKIFPKISPKKTWAGCIAGVFGGAAGSIVVWCIFELALGVPLNAPLRFEALFNSRAYGVAFYLAAGAIISVVSQIGDLAASRIKRSFDIKDFSTLLGTHGGVMDRIDSILFSISIMAIIMSFVI
jgi:phosphatidate cytidylyltransferase